MRYLLSTSGALLLGHTVRFICGSWAGACTFISVLLFSISFDRSPLLFLLLAAGIWAGVHLAHSHALPIMSLVPVGALIPLLLVRSSAAPTGGLFIADFIALISLAYRGWANKRLLD